MSQRKKKQQNFNTNGGVRKKAGKVATRCLISGGGISVNKKDEGEINRKVFFVVVGFQRFRFFGVKKIMSFLSHKKNQRRGRFVRRFCQNNVWGDLVNKGGGEEKDSSIEPIYRLLLFRLLEVQ